MQNIQKISPLAPMLALSLLPAMFLLGGMADNYLLFALGVLLSMLPEGVLLAVINALRRKQPHTLFVKPLLAALALFFLAAGTAAVCRFADISGFLSQYRISPLLITLPLVLSAVYIASLSQGAQRRLCTAVLMTVLGLYGITALMALKNGSTANLHISSSAPTQDISAGLTAGAFAALPAAYYLTLCLIGGFGRVRVLRYLAVKGLILLTFTIPVIYVLGEHIRYSRMPAYDLAAFSNSIIIERFNGLYVLILCISTAVLAAVCLNAVRLCIGAIISKKGVSYEKA